MRIRPWMLICALAALLSAGYLAYQQTNLRSAGNVLEVIPTDGYHEAADGNQMTTVVDVTIAPAENSLRIEAKQILASVNGRDLRLADLMPLSSATTEQTLSPETYEYLLGRALNRELVLQAAKAQGLELNQSQREQLARYRSQRQQKEPGLVARLNGDQLQLDFEQRDMEAFMLQVSLLAQTGASPSVQPAQVREYYRQHSLEFGDLPADEPARSETWEGIDFDIRTRLAQGERSRFQSQLLVYMDQIKARANIFVTPASDLRTSQ